MNHIENDLSGIGPSVREAIGRLHAARLRPLLLGASFALALAAAPAGAVEEHHPETSGSTPGDVVSSQPSVAPTVQKMQENVREMQSQLDRVAAAKTDDERRDALAEHMRTMQQNMALGRNMMMMGAAGGCPMMGGGMMGPGMMGPGMMGGGMMGGTGVGGAGPAEMQRMERRLDMMQMMMEQLMQARQAQPGVAPSTPVR